MVFHYLFLNNIRKSTIISFYVGFLCFRVLICKGLRPSTLRGGILLIFESPQWKGDPSGPTSNACSHADIVPLASHPHLASLSLQTHWTHTCLMTKPWVCCPAPMLCPPRATRLPPPSHLLHSNSCPGPVAPSTRQAFLSFSVHSWHCPHRSTPSTGNVSLPTS